MKVLYVFLLFFLFVHLANAQCPVASGCTPGTAPASAHLFGMGIYNVTVGSGPNGFSNATTGGVTDGYQNYSCTKKATVLEGAPTVISVTTNPNAEENVRAWADLNNNGTFEAATELIFSSDNKKVHSGTFTIPVSASVVKNQVLRMRISADNFSSAIPNPCSTPQYSQVEDYGITVVSNANKPTVNFSVNNPVTCSPTVQFSELTQNGATSFLWTFGDGTTSTAANPAHSYAATGTYTVKLKACNAAGCDSLTKTNYVTYHTNVPVATSCTPTTTAYCCGYGITKVTFHTLVNSSANGSAGYEDFTCSKSVIVEENVSYPIALETGTANSQDTWIYIDYNNNGTFESAELAFSKLNSFNPSGNIQIQTGTVKNIPLRMRIISDEQGSLQGPCANRTTGQIEDYTLITTANLRKPSIAFTSNFSNLCDSVVQFTDASLYGATTYTWDFGDNSLTSTLQNPQHRYLNPGSYSVKLKACNAYGCDSLTKVNYISFTRVCPTYCTPSFNGNNNFGITNVTLGNINNPTGFEANAYGDYTTLSTTLIKGRWNTITSTSNSTRSRTTTVYIDYNQDGDFLDAHEKVATGGSVAVFSKTFMVPTTAKSGVTRMRVMASALPFTSCSNSKNGLETEDYSVYIIPNNQPPTALFTTLNRNSCSFDLAFSDTSANSATSWAWDFGDPVSGPLNTSTLQHPRHTFSGPGTYTIQLTSCNNYGCNTLTKTAYLTITGNNGPKGITCRPFTYEPHILFGIYNVTFNTINNSTSSGDGYQDYACSISTTVTAENSYPISIRNGTNYNEDVRVWIDYNNDGTFNPVSELIFASNLKKLHTGTITIPATAVQNQPLRMRVASEYSSYFAPPQPCGNLQGGQAEDYAITVTGTTGIAESKLTENINIYPNPSDGTFSLEIPTVLKSNYQLEVQNLVGQTVAKQALKVSTGQAQEIDLKHLPKGVYLLKVSNEKAAAIKKIIIE